jgi:uncharacterized protein YndB with AHSA1/START domain
MNEVVAEVVVPVSVERAFTLFTRDVHRWWRRGERYGGTDVVAHRFEPRLGGRFLEVLADGEHALGVITAWEPPQRLVFTWRQGNWTPDEVTHVEVRFAAVRDGTRVVLRHSGFDAVRSEAGCDVGYAAGWRELLSWYGAFSATSEESAACT